MDDLIYLAYDPIATLWALFWTVYLLWGCEP